MKEEEINLSNFKFRKHGKIHGVTKVSRFEFIDILVFTLLLGVIGFLITVIAMIVRAFI